MKNTLEDLNNILFEQLERMRNDSLSTEEFQNEIERSRTISNLATRVIEGAKITLEAQKHFDEYGIKRQISLPLKEKI